MADTRRDRQAEDPVLKSKKKELASLLDTLEEGWEFYFSRGVLNSEGRKICVRIGVLAGSVFRGSSLNTTQVIADGSDLSVMKNIKKIRELLASG
ncbi:MAG: hypothetical protein QW767_03365 [Thermoprotei archaeon]